MNKYYKALEIVGNRLSYTPTQFDEAMQTLNNLIIKMEKIGLELNNTHFMDNDCKLKTLEIIERIFRE